MNQILSCQAAFLSDIIEYPEDDTPRLVFADWLMDHGQEERGEFIAVQCALARYPRAPTGLSDGFHEAAWREGMLDLRHRQQELLTPRSFWEWFGPLVSARWTGSPAVAINPQTLTCTLGQYNGDDDEHWTLIPRRGFIEEITLPTRDWIGVGCERCNGAGKVPVKWFGRDIENTCTKCNGKKRYNAHGPVLVRSTSLVRVTLTDREPARYARQHAPALGFYYRWFLEGHTPGRPDFPVGWEVPEPLWSVYLKTYNTPARWQHASRQEALDALSDTCLQWAKDQR